MGRRGTAKRSRPLVGTFALIFWFFCIKAKEQDKNRNVFERQESCKLEEQDKNRNVFAKKMVQAKKSKIKNEACLQKKKRS